MTNEISLDSEQPEEFKCSILFHLIDFTIVIYANHMLRSAYPAMVKCAERILETTRCLEASEEYCMPIKQILNLIPGTKKK